VAELSFNPSVNGPNQGHNSIGSNGSFWLPPKMRTGDFKSNLQKYNSNSQKSNHQLNASGIHQQAKLNYSGVARPGDSAPKMIGSSQLASSTYIKSSGSSKVSAQTVKPSSVSVKSLHRNSPIFAKLMNHPLSYNASDSFLHSKPASSSKVILSGLDERSGAKLAKEVSDLKFDGTKSAFFKHNPDEPAFKRHKYFPSEEVFTHSNSVSPDELLDRLEHSFNGNAVGFSHNKGILRFAFSLDNGSSVSIRIKKSECNFQICFITDNIETQNYLANKLHSFSNNLSIPTDHSLNLHIFSSYKHMDKTFSNSNSND